MSVRRVSVDIFVDGVVEIFDFVHISGLHGVGDAVLQMILEYDAGGAVQSGTHGGKLHQNLGAIAPFLHHALYGFQMADSAGKAVHNGLALRVDVAVLAMRVLILQVLAQIIVRLVLMAVEYSVSMVVIVKIFVVWQVHIVHLIYGLFNHTLSAKTFQAPSGDKGKPSGNMFWYGGERMLESAFLILMGSAFLMLRLSPGGSFPKPLSEKDEKIYLERWMNGDVEARNVLIEHNLRLVSHIIKKYYTQCSDMEDLVSIGTIGLIKGINTYRPDKGVRLATYASRCTENEILMHFRSQKKSSGDVSLSDTLDVDGDGNSLSLMDIIAEEDDMADRIGHFEICGKLREYVDSVLEPREAEIIKLRYGLGGQTPKTQRETADMCGISRSYVSRIEKKALAKLRSALGEEAAAL